MLWPVTLGLYTGGTGTGVPVNWHSGRWQHGSLGSLSSLHSDGNEGKSGHLKKKMNRNYHKNSKY